MSKQTNWLQLLIFTIVMSVIYVLFMPTFVNLVLFKIVFPAYYVEHTLGILRWDIVFQDSSIAVASLFLWIAFMVATFSSTFGNKKNVGTEHGSAKFMTDKEFDALVPNYMFRKDEYAYPRSDEASTKMNYLKESNKDIFEDIDFEEVEVYE